MILQAWRVWLGSTRANKLKAWQKSELDSQNIRKFEFKKNKMKNLKIIIVKIYEVTEVQKSVNTWSHR